MKAQVYFLPFKGKRNELSWGIGKLLELLRVEEVVKKGDLCAVKVHFGEEGNFTYLRPDFVRPVIDRLKALGAKPFLTDTSTLYKGSRSDAVSHLETALRHGFTLESVSAPVIIADGLKGQDVVRVRIEGRIYEEVEVAMAIYSADSLIVLSHFKGHDLSGFGGALKNLGMGCTGRRGKMSQHSEVAPRVIGKRCKGCGRCVKECPSEAISLKEGKAQIEEQKCIGCGQCIVCCEEKAIEVRWKRDSELFQKKMVEHALGVLKGKEGRVLFLNFLSSITPLCDCWSKSDPAVVPDIGVLGSRDPVAIDQASIDLVNQKAQEDIFRRIHHFDWSVQLRYAEELGLGRRSYELFEIG
jgi:uncharacterized Fe-S center protein